MSQDTRPLVLFVDDVELDLGKYRRGMALAATYRVMFVETVEKALEIATQEKVDAAVIDLKMPSGPLNEIETDHGEATGLVLAAKLVEINPKIKTLLLSNEEAGDQIEPAFRARLNIHDTLVKLDCKPIDLIRALDRMFGVCSFTPTIFIVHGHDRNMVEFVQELVENELGWTRPIVLDEQAGGGLTIIEKFEKFAARADAVLVLMTPDDVGASSKELDSKQFRARQNVLFELGYFYGKFRRQSGRVFVLKGGDLEMPTDLSGIVYLNMLEGEGKVRDRLVAELKHIFGPALKA